MSNTILQNDAPVEVERGAQVRFAAIDRRLETPMVLPTETVVKGKGGGEMVRWGDNNDYPGYLLDLYNSVATLRSIINGCVDFAVGNGVEVRDGYRFRPDGTVNRRGQTWRELLKQVQFNFWLFGGFALQIIRGHDGSLSELYSLDLRFVRTDKENEVFYYSESFGKRFARQDQVLVYPKFIQGADAPSSILLVKNTYTQVYPAPLYGASITACETERAIDGYHLNAIRNGFAASYFVNFNNGVPSQEIQEEIADNFEKKFTGWENAMRVGFSWNESRANATTFEKLDVSDYGEKYGTLARHCRQQLFTSFRANPNLFGIPTENLGFSSEEYEQAFRLFNRTQIRPAQDLFVDAIDRVIGIKDSLVITPFTID